MSSIQPDRYQGLDVFRLTNGDMEILVCPKQGMNVCRAMWRGTAFIDTDPDRLKSGGTFGTPMLYPAPNRTRDGAFVFEGRPYRITRKGEPVTLHGLARSQPFRVTDSAAEENGAHITGEIDFAFGTPLYEGYPFRHTLEITVRLKVTGYSVGYRVGNLGEGRLPFAFGLHPFFYRRGRTLIRVGARSFMPQDGDAMATGKLIAVEKSGMDLREYQDINLVVYNDFFADIIEYGDVARIFYPDSGFGVRLKATEDFGYVVVFSPAGFPYFCIENQTCPNNAHNLYAQGFGRESGLIVLEPGQEHSGEVAFEIFQQK